jgi:hypothetical protein
MNWNPSYSYAVIPPGLAVIPPYYKVLATPVPPERGLAHFRNVHIWNITATGAKRAFDVSATAQAPLEHFTLDHINIAAQSAGTVANARDWTLSHVDIKTSDGSRLDFSDTSALKLIDDQGIAAGSAN